MLQRTESTDSSVENVTQRFSFATAHHRLLSEHDFLKEISSTNIGHWPAIIQSLIVDQLYQNAYELEDEDPQNDSMIGVAEAISKISITLESQHQAHSHWSHQDLGKDVIKEFLYGQATIHQPDPSRSLHNQAFEYFKTVLLVNFCQAIATTVYTQLATNSELDQAYDYFQKHHRLTEDFRQVVSQAILEQVEKIKSVFQEAFNSQETLLSFARLGSTGLSVSEVIPDQDLIAQLLSEPRLGEKRDQIKIFQNIFTQLLEDVRIVGRRPLPTMNSHEQQRQFRNYLVLAIAMIMVLSGGGLLLGHASRQTKASEAGNGQATPTPTATKPDQEGGVPGGAGKPFSYVVKANEAVLSIARQYYQQQGYANPHELARAIVTQNNLREETRGNDWIVFIEVGQNLIIPSNQPPTAEVAAAAVEAAVTPTPIPQVESTVVVSEEELVKQRMVRNFDLVVKLANHDQAFIDFLLTNFDLAVGEWSETFGHNLVKISQVSKYDRRYYEYLSSKFDLHTSLLNPEWIASSYATFTSNIQLINVCAAKHGVNPDKLYQLVSASDLTVAHAEESIDLVAQGMVEQRQTYARRVARKRGIQMQWRPARLG